MARKRAIQIGISRGALPLQRERLLFVFGLIIVWKNARGFDGFFGKPIKTAGILIGLLPHLLLRCAMRVAFGNIVIKGVGV